MTDMIREHPLHISPSLIEKWEREIQTGTPEQLKEKYGLCTTQRRSWMASARSTKAIGVRPWVDVNMAWKYHRHLMMLLRAERPAQRQTATQLSLF